MPGFMPGILLPQFLFFGLYVHRFPGQRDRIPTARLGWLLPEFFHDRLSSERDIPAQACRFSCFFCAAYGLLLPQTRTQCSNSAPRAIAMLEKSAKISPNACAVVSLLGERRSCGKLLHFLKRCNAYIWCLWAICPHNTCKGNCRSCRTDDLHRFITFRNQSADLSACAGRPLADFRRLGEHSDFFENTV